MSQVGPPPDLADRRLQKPLHELRLREDGGFNVENRPYCTGGCPVCSPSDSGACARGYGQPRRADAREAQSIRRESDYGCTNRPRESSAVRDMIPLSVLSPLDTGGGGQMGPEKHAFSLLPPLCVGASAGAAS